MEATKSLIEQAKLDWARRDLMGFIKYTFPSYIIAPHNELIAKKLMAVERGEVTRLIVSLSPRHGKTEAICRFIAWCLGRHPEWPFIYASYGEGLAVSKSRLIRSVVDGDEFREVFPGVVLSSESSAAHDWRIADLGGGVFAAGVGSGITGRGFKIGVLDDLIKDRQAASSQTILNHVWEWYRSTFYTRMEEFGAENAAIVLINTRWSPDDPAGRLLDTAVSEPGADQWATVTLPAIATESDVLGREVGEPLWPEKYGLDDLERIRANISSWEFQAQYQQDPQRRGGGLFERHWFEIVREAPAGLQWVRFWDLAATAATGSGDPDWTSGAKVAYSDGVYYIGDIRRMRGTPQAVRSFIRQTAQLDGSDVWIYIEQEPGSGGVNTIDTYRREVLPGYTVRGRRPQGDKILRAEPVSATAEAGNVKLLVGAWNQAYIDEAAVFPAGKKDQVDSVSGAFAVFQERMRRQPGVRLIGRRQLDNDDVV